MERTVLPYRAISAHAFKIATELDERMPARTFDEAQHRVDQAIATKRGSCIARAIFAAARLSQAGIPDTYLMFRNLEHTPGFNAHGQLLVPVESSSLWGIRIEGVRSLSAYATRVSPLSRTAALRYGDLAVLRRGQPLTLNEPSRTDAQYIVLPVEAGIDEYNKRFRVAHPESFAEAKATVDALPPLEV